MTNASQPQRPHQQPMSPAMLAFLLSTGVAFSILFMQFSEVGAVLAKQIFEKTALAQARNITEDAWASLLIACQSDRKCNPWLGAQLSAGMRGYWFALLLPLVVTPIIARLFPAAKTVPMKDPGLAEWERKENMKRFLRENEDPDDEFVAFMGYLKSGTKGGEFDGKTLPPLFIPREDWCQNTLVWGGIRSGKTTSFFQPNIFLAAHLNVTCVVFDVKWPQKNSGFFETIGYWNARGRPTVLLAPFEEYGARVNLLGNVNNFSDALEVADAVFPPPEFQEERGRHYNDKKRFMIAALIWLLRTEEGDNATMRHVLEYVMMPDDRLMAWVEKSRDENAKSILTGYYAAGATNFAETKNGIVSALKVFFNDRVVQATSGLKHEVIDLRTCFRDPHLVLVGINQKNMMDGSGEVLFRLYKRLLDSAALQVAEEDGGRLKVHNAVFLDELPSIGRINYMMRSLGTLRSYNISHHLGIQNDAQGELVYGDIYWKAITTNVVARVIVFPRGINGDDARKVSDIIGKTTAGEMTIGGSRSINPFEGVGSNSTSMKLTDRDLLSYEEFSQFSLGEAVVRMNGQHPIRTQLVPMNMKYVNGTGIRRNKTMNVLHGLYAETVKSCEGGLIAYTTRLIEQGLVKGQRPVHAVMMTSLTKRPPTRPASLRTPAPVSAPVPASTPAQIPASAARLDRSKPAPAPAPAPAQSSNAGRANRPTQDAIDWLHSCMSALVELNVLEPEGVISVRVNRNDPSSPANDEAVHNLFIGGLVSLSKTKLEAHLTPKVMRDVSEAVMADIKDYILARPLYGWLYDNRHLIAGTPERLKYEADCAASEPPRETLDPIDAIIEQGTLICAKKHTREAFRSSSTLSFPERRVDTRSWHIIPITDFAATAAAVRAATVEPTVKPEKGKSRRARKASSDAALAQEVLASAHEPHPSP